MQKWVFNKRTIKVCVSCSCWRPPPRLSSEAHPTVFLFLCSSKNNTQGESRALEGCRDSNDLFYKKETEKKLVSGQTWSTRRKKPIIAVFLVQFMHHHSKGQHEKSATYTTLLIARKTLLTRENISETFWSYLRVNCFLAKIKAFQEWNVFFRIQITEELLWSVLKNHGKLQNIFLLFFLIFNSLAVLLFLWWG